MPYQNVTVGMRCGANIRRQQLFTRTRKMCIDDASSTAYPPGLNPDVSIYQRVPAILILLDPICSWPKIHQISSVPGQMAMHTILRKTHQPLPFVKVPD
jgi:hypothetical protein